MDESTRKVIDEDSALDVEVQPASITIDEESDRDLGEYLLSHESIKCPPNGKTISGNFARVRQWSPGTQEYIKSASQSASQRYNGALVADFHRCLLEGGIYFYPADPSHPNGKLRLLYECAPLAMIVEQAGGKASTGDQRILGLEVESIHQRVPLVIGSANDVSAYEKHVQQEKVTT